MSWDQSLLGPKPSSAQLRRAIQPDEDFTRLSGAPPTQTFSAFVAQFDKSAGARRIALPQQRLYIVGLGKLADENDTSTPSLTALTDLVTTFLGAPRAADGRRELPALQLYEILSRAQPADAFYTLTMTAEAVPDHPVHATHGVVDVAHCGASLARCFEVVCRALLHALGVAPCATWQCIHNEVPMEAQELCPACLRKLHYATNINPTMRYQELQRSYSRVEGLHKVAAWVARRLSYLAVDGLTYLDHFPLQALFSNGEWYSATITTRHEDGTVDVMFDDGVPADGLLPDQVRPKAGASTWDAPQASKGTATSGQIDPGHYGADGMGGSLTLLKAKNSKHGGKSRRVGRRPSLGAEEYKTCLEAFYRKHHPDKLDKVEKLLESYSGREEKLLSTIEQKYGLQPGYILAASGA